MYRIVSKFKNNQEAGWDVGPNLSYIELNFVYMGIQGYLEPPITLYKKCEIQLQRSNEVIK